MTIKEVDMGKAGKRYRDTDTGKLTSKAAFKAQIQVPAVSITAFGKPEPEHKTQLIKPKSNIGPSAPADFLSPITSMKDSIQHIALSMTTLVELTRQSLKLQKGGGRDSMIAGADFIGPPKPTGELSGGQGEKFKMPEIGPKLGLALMLAGLAILFKFADKLIPVIAKILEIAKKIYTNALDFINDPDIQEAKKGAITGPGVVVGVLKKQNVNLLTALKNSKFWKFVTSGFGLLDTSSGGPPGSTKAGLLTRILSIFKPLTTIGGTIMKLPVIATVTSFFAKTGPFLKLFGKLFYPLTIIIGLFDTIMGAFDGYKESDEETTTGVVLDTIAGGIKGLLLSLVGIPLDFINASLAWILKKMGFDEGKVDAALTDFKWTDFLGDFVDNFFADFIKPIGKWIATLITDPVEAIKQLWTATVGEGGFLDMFYKPIDAAISWLLGIFKFDEPNTALTDEEGNFIGIKELSINALRSVFNWIKSKLSFDIPGFDLPSLPKIKDILMNLLGGMLPDPNGGLIAKGFYKAADKLGFGSLREAALAFQEGGLFNDGVFQTTAGTGMDSDVNTIETGETLETVEKATAKGDKFAEAQKESLALQGGPPGTVIMDNSVTKGGDVATSSATYQAEAAIDHSDRTAMLASLNQMIVN